MTGRKAEAAAPNETDHTTQSDTDSPMAVGSVVMQAWMDLGNEAIRFVWDRLQQDLETQKAVLACTSLEEVQKVQAAFFRSAQEQYAAEARKMLEMIGKATTAGMTATAAARRYNDVPL
jgi:hypothetical protein